MGKQKAMIYSTGMVKWTRLIRVRVSFGTNIGNYPYDHQATEIKIASLDNTIDLVKIVTAQWNGLHNVRANITNVNTTTIDKDGQEVNYRKENDLNLEFPFVQHERFGPNSEWNWYSYSYAITNDKSLTKNNQAYSTLTLRMKLKRNHEFFTLTLFVPILILTLISTVGLILPVECGEKMGFQVTILLSYVIYIDMLQSSVPVFDSFGSSPLIMQFFVVSSIILCICMLGTDYDVIIN